MLSTEPSCQVPCSHSQLHSSSVTSHHGTGFSSVPKRNGLHCLVSLLISFQRSSVPLPGGHLLGHQQALEAMSQKNTTDVLLHDSALARALYSSRGGGDFVVMHCSEDTRNSVRGHWNFTVQVIHSFTQQNWQSPMLGIGGIIQTRTDTEVPGLMGLAAFTFGLSSEIHA